MIAPGAVPLADVWSDLGAAAAGALKTAAEAAIFVAVGLAVIGLVAAARTLLIRLLPTRKGNAVSVVDLTADPKERNLRNYALTRELVTAVHSAVQGFGRGSSTVTGIDETRDVDGTVAAGLGLTGAWAERVDTLVYDDAPVKLGPLSFSARQLLLFGGTFFRRRSDHELVGTLTSLGPRTLLFVERRDGRRRTAVEHWATVHEGSDARGAVVSDVGAQIAVSLGGSHVSSDWDSFREYRRGMELMAPTSGHDETEQRLRQAQEAFQRALEADPCNVPARLSLAIALRRAGRNEEAAWHFDFLERLAKEVPEDSPIRRFVDRHPELAFVARYNRGVALAKTNDWRSHTQAVEIFEGLAKLSSNAEAQMLQERDCFRIEMLARSALASALVFRLEQGRLRAGGENGKPRQEDFRRKTFARIVEQREWIERLPATTASLQGAAYMEAYATCHNAVGHACVLLGRFDEARVALRRAIAMMPNLGDAYTNLGWLAVKTKRRSFGWPTEAEELLRRALAISPRDERAYFFLGSVLSAGGVRRYTEAKDAFARAASNPWAHLRHAELLDAEGDHAGAVDLLGRSLSLDDRLDYRTKFYLDVATKLVKAGTAGRPLVDEARRVADRAQKSGGPGEQRAAARFFQAIARARTSVPAGAAAPPSPAGPVEV